MRTVGTRATNAYLTVIRATLAIAFLVLRGQIRSEAYMGRPTQISRNGREE